MVSTVFTPEILHENAEKLDIGNKLAHKSLLIWVRQFIDRPALIELVTIIVVMGLLWLLVGRLRRKLHNQSPDSLLFGAHLHDGVLLPFLGLMALNLAQIWLAQFQPVLLLPLTNVALLSLLLLRLSVRALNRTFSGRPWVAPLSHWLAGTVWLCVLAWVTGLGATVLQELSSITWVIGGTRITLSHLLESMLLAAGFLLASMWLSSELEQKLLSTGSNARLPARKMIATFVRVMLLVIGLLIALNIAGINLTALSVFGGALGVGIGLGLQRLASNYLSGFVLLAERVLHVGDEIRINGFQGTISEISGRYTSLIADNGRQAIVPHEMLTNSLVEKSPSGHLSMLQELSVLVSYDNDDIAAVPALMIAAAQRCARVLSTPETEAMLINIDVKGLEFKLDYYISCAFFDDEEEIRSEINLAIMAAFKAAGVRLSTALDETRLQELLSQLIDRQPRPATRPADTGAPAGPQQPQ